MARNFLENTRLNKTLPGADQLINEGVFPKGSLISQLIRNPDFSMEMAETLLLASGHHLNSEELRAIHNEIKYVGYIRQQDAEIKRLTNIENLRMPAGLDYKKIPGVSTEMSQRLERSRPATLGQASRIPGLTPATVSILRIYLNTIAKQKP